MCVCGGGVGVPAKGRPGAGEVREAEAMANFLTEVIRGRSSYPILFIILTPIPNNS